MEKPDRYVGIDKDINGGMTSIGKIVRDACNFQELASGTDYV